MLLERNKNVSNGCLTVTFYCFYTAIIYLMKCLGLVPVSASIARVKMSCEPFLFGREISVCLTHTVCVFVDAKSWASSETVFGYQPPGVERYWCGSLYQDHWLCASCEDFLGSGMKYSDLMAVATRDKSSLYFSAISALYTCTVSMVRNGNILTFLVC